MKYWVTTDTHFGHDKMMEYCGRPKGFEDLIFKYHSEIIKKDDVLVHLGDFCIYNDEKWHDEFIADLYIWLMQEFPPPEDPEHDGAHIISRRESIADFRNGLLNSLIRRKTTTSFYQNVKGC